MKSTHKALPTAKLRVQGEDKIQMSDKVLQNLGAKQASGGRLVSDGSDLLLQYILVKIS